MTVKELIERLSLLPNHDAEVLVQVPDPNDPEAPDDYAIEDVTFMGWPRHYRSTGEASGVAELSRPQAYIKVLNFESGRFDHRSFFGEVRFQDPETGVSGDLILERVMLSGDEFAGMAERLPCGRRAREPGHHSPVTAARAVQAAPRDFRGFTEGFDDVHTQRLDVEWPIARLGEDVTLCDILAPSTPRFEHRAQRFDQRQIAHRAVSLRIIDVALHLRRGERATVHP
jgi:hypothetical protein